MFSEEYMCEQKIGGLNKIRGEGVSQIALKKVMNLCVL